MMARPGLLLNGACLSKISTPPSLRGKKQSLAGCGKVEKDRRDDTMLRFPLVKHVAYGLVLLITLQLVTIKGLAGPLEPPKGIRHYEVGAAPSFSVTDMDGEPFELASTRGQWVFLHFWASWCGPCRKEMPSIQNLGEAFDEPGLQIVLINTAEDEDTIFSFLGEIGMDMNSLMDRDGLVTEKFKPRGLPTTILIDRDGKIQYQAIGGREWHKPQYTEFLRQLIAEF